MMQKRIGLVVAFILFSYPAMSAGNEREQDKQAIRAHIEKIFEAYIKKDVETIRTTHSEDWIGFTVRARSIQRGIDEYMKSANEALQSPHLVSGYKITEIDFAFFGDVALVPYVADISSGKERVPGKLRSLDVYQKIKGEWIQVGSNIYLHPDTVENMRTNTTNSQ